MKVVVMSDSHGNFTQVRRIVDENKDTVQTFIHLGDGLEEFNDVRNMYPHLHFLAVKGNNDWGSMEEKIKLITLGDKLVLLTHGDLMGVKLGKTTLYKEAKKLKADIALYGHTHRVACDCLDGIYIMNPGSVNDGRSTGQTYLILEIFPEKVSSQVIFLDEN